MERETVSVTEADITFWARKKACWEMCHCPEAIKSQCPAPRYPFVPCWEIEGTYLKLNPDGRRGDNTSLCRVCRVYRTYGRNEPIEIKLWDRGLNAQFRELSEKAERIRG